ncbi:glycine zipper 2TM domain-containing protein [Microbulbifer sp. 2205BS26-8]|uniref:glycine zipper 2TM domain-containing protein n=1 Tax=Microbulbifer sp. 2205BS26-8 TaxID=3064386 RepID=UPI00273EDE26|nr:glycine zipper 2TM domain-containing protein [Microbulbifer sp. 2205BS26-8]MDP5209954.1 glycine zipper 2TM domain-containing protein [Microbulbifer sp. 2205BS26-8]
MQCFKQLVAGAAIVTLLSMSVSVKAGPGGYTGSYDADIYDYAPVTEVIPVYTDVQVRTPRTQCREEQVAYREPASPAGTLVGGLIGAAIGNNLGSRHHHRGGATVAGAVVGALVGNQISRTNAPVYYTTEPRCRVVDEFTTRRELVGYDVRYRYNDRSYLTRTDHHPGDSIRVRVAVSPAP